jgi:YbbR domain-containing protein
VNGALRLLARAGRATLTNLPLLLLSLALALALWVYVTNEENPTLSRRFDALVVHTTGQDITHVPDNAVVTDVNPEQVSVRVSGPTGQVNSLQTGDIQLHLDLSHPAEGVQCEAPQVVEPASTASATPAAAPSVTPAPARSTVCTVPVRATVRGHGNISADIVEPPDAQHLVTVTLAPIVKRTVQVKVGTIGVLPVGFEISAPPVASPAEVVVSGLQQDVNNVDAAYADLSLTNLGADTTTSLQLNARDASGRQVGEVQVQPQTVQVHVGVKRTVFPRDMYVSVPIKGTPAPGYTIVSQSIDPASVTAQGTIDALNAVTTIPADGVDVGNATADVKTVVTLRPPQGITVTGVKTVAVTVAIQPLHGPGSVVVAPRFVNLGPGLYAQSTTLSLTVAFSGPEPQILALKAGDIQATVDLSGLGPGNYNREPKVTLPAGLELDASQPLRVDFTILALPQQAPPASTPSAAH